MPRTHIRTTAKASWTDEQLQAALDAIRRGEKIRAVGRRFNIHEATLRKRLKTGLAGGPAMGKKAVFKNFQEEEICSHLLHLAKLFYGVTLTELRRMAFEYAEQNKIKHNFNKTTKLAGKDWAQGFLKRNPQLSLRKPEATSINRILAFNKEAVKKFFTNLETVMDKYKFPASRIFNVDETGISTVQKPPSIIGPKGQKQVGSATSLERGRNITVCCAMSATGMFLPPMFIFPGVRATAGMKRGGPAETIYEMSQSGWMTDELFRTWLRHFVLHTKSSKEEPTLLLLDNHASHTSLAAYEFCRDNGIVVVSFPPHTSHRLQPLDLTFFGPLKAAYNRECSLFLKNNGFQKICKEDVPALFKSSFEKTAGVSKAVTGFGKPGIYPLNPDVFTDDDFLPAAVGAMPEVIEKEPDLEIPATHTSKGNQHVPITQISPVPQPSTSKSAGIQNPKRRPKQHSEILTATPRKTILEELDKKRKKRVEAADIRVKKTKEDNKKKKAKKVLRFTDDSSSNGEEENITLRDLVDDDEMDDLTLDVNQGEKNDTNNKCLFCGEFGKDNELWYRCVLCSGWVHSDCSAVDTPENFVCDYCQSK